MIKCWQGPGQVRVLTYCWYYYKLVVQFGEQFGNISDTKMHIPYDTTNPPIRTPEKLYHICPRGNVLGDSYFSITYLGKTIESIQIPISVGMDK